MGLGSFPLGGDQGDVVWSDLGTGAPTLAAFAKLCSRAMALPELPTPNLSPEAKALLFSARNRGVFEVKGSNDAFEAPARFLAVRVALDEDSWLVFRGLKDASMTIRFLDGFRELCAAGLVLHHLYRDFSLSRAGFDIAGTIAEEDVQDLLAQASKLSRYE